MTSTISTRLISRLSARWTKRTVPRTQGQNQGGSHRTRPRRSMPHASVSSVKVLGGLNFARQTMLMAFPGHEINKPVTPCIVDDRGWEVSHLRKMHRAPPDMDRPSVGQPLGDDLECGRDLGPSVRNQNM